MSLFNWFRSSPVPSVPELPPAPTPPKPQPIPQPAFAAFSLEEWRSFPVYTDYSRSLFQDPMFQRLMGVLQSEVPAVYPLGSIDVAAAQVALNIIPGYQRCMQILMASQVPLPEPVPTIPETYPDPNLNPTE